MELKELYQLIIEKQSIQNKLNELMNQQSNLTTNIDEFKKNMNKEQKDVERLENMTLTSILTNLFDNKEEKLNKERKEAYEAKLKYDSSIMQYQSVNADIKYYQSKLEEIYNCEEEYEILLKEKKESLKDKIEVIELDKKISETLHYQNEINEAIEEAANAHHICSKILNYLKDANDFATVDVFFKGGILMHSLKYDLLDKAQEEFNRLQVQLNKLKTELVDIHIQQNIELSIDNWSRSVDYWFDNMLTDLQIKDKIIQSISQTEKTNLCIVNLINDLNTMLEEQTNIKHKLQSELEKLIVFR